MADGFDWDGDDPYDLADQLERLGEALREELVAVAEDIALRIEADAKKNSPVDTGTLRASISSVVEDLAGHTVKAVIGSNVEYAPYQELGTSKMSAQPFLRPAIESNRRFIVERVEEAVENAVDRAD